MMKTRDKTKIRKNLFFPLDNKYTNLYFRIIENRKLNPIKGYVEKHHIHPYALGGSDDKINLVKLTAREHFICHLLLSKMFLKGDAKIKMTSAFYLMKHGHSKMHRYAPNSFIYSIYAKTRDRTASEETKAKMSTSIKASYTPELLTIRSEYFKNRIVSDKTRQIMSNNRKGWGHMDPVKREQARINLSNKQKQTVGEKHARSKEWTLVKPDGEIIKTKYISKICEDFNISYSAFRNKALDKDISPMKKGTGKGWSVLSCV